jgi:predicted acylesterase/phospholipase RssA
MKRSLILAGGGMKVGYQAGAMQVLLDEVGLDFAHADGTSGGCFNLAMLQSGLSGTQIADNWRHTSPFDALWPQPLYRYLMPWRLPGLASYNRFRRHLLPKWGVDFDKIRRSTIQGSYNIFDFTNKRPEILTQRDITPDLFFGCVSLPMFFPSVHDGGKTYIDAVYYRDANLAEAIRQGAEEIWVIWTVNETPEYKGGFYHQYFHIIEAIADARFYDELVEVERINEAVRAGTDKEHRHITVHTIRHGSPVPMDYLIYFRAKQMSRIVDMGIEDTRAYVAAAGLSSKSPVAAKRPVSLEFTERMSGELRPTAGTQAEAGKQPLVEHPISFEVTIKIDDLDRFIDEPDHAAHAAGHLDCDELGGRCVIEGGAFNLFVQDPSINLRRMLYRLPIVTSAGGKYTLEGEKDIPGAPAIDLWGELSTLYATLRRSDGADAEVVGNATLRLRLQDLPWQLSTFRVDQAASRAEQAITLARFGRFFFQELWDQCIHHMARHRP